MGEEKPIKFELMLEVEQVANGFIATATFDDGEPQKYVAPTLFDLIKSLVSVKLGITEDTIKAKPERSDAPPMGKGERLLQGRYQSMVKRYGFKWVGTDSLTQLFGVKSAQVGNIMREMRKKGLVEVDTRGQRKFYRVRRDPAEGL